jgi:hypothetical protein
VSSQETYPSAADAPDDDMLMRMRARRKIMRVMMMVLIIQCPLMKSLQVPPKGTKGWIIH